MEYKRARDREDLLIILNTYPINYIKYLKKELNSEEINYYKHLRERAKNERNSRLIKTIREILKFHDLEKIHYYLDLIYLSEKLLEEFKEFVNWKTVSERKDLSKEFIERNCKREGMMERYLVEIKGIDERIL